MSDTELDIRLTKMRALSACLVWARAHGKTDRANSVRTRLRQYARELAEGMGYAVEEKGASRHGS